jgi:hypothetical protein
VFAVEREIEEIVEDIDGRSHRAERDECQQAFPDHVGVEVFVRQHHRHRDERVLQPLMNAQHLDDGSECRLRRRHHFGTVRGLPARGSAVGRDDDCRARGIEHPEVVPAVSGIVEAAIAIGGDKRSALSA